MRRRARPRTGGGVRSAIATSPDAFVARVDALGVLLEQKGRPARSPWWKAETARLVREAWGCPGLRAVRRVGRRGGKSSEAEVLAVAFALYWPWKVPPTDTAHVSFISTTRDEAAQRLTGIKFALDALGLKYSPCEGGIEVSSPRRVRFKVFASTASGTRGPTSVIAFLDEACWFRAAEDGANNAEEVAAAFAATLATTDGPMIISSSPNGDDDYHASQYAMGDGPGRIVAHAPSWVANPTLTEDKCRALAGGDERVFLREYAAVPQSGAFAAFDAEKVNACFGGSLGSDYALCTPILVTDPSGLGDAWTGAVIQWAIPHPERYETRTVYLGNGRYAEDVVLDANGKAKVLPAADVPPRLVVRDIVGFQGSFWQREGADVIVGKLAQLALTNGCPHVVADQHQSFVLAAAFARHRLAYHALAWTSPTKAEAVGLVKTWFRNGVPLLPDAASNPLAARVRAELHAYQETVRANGVTYGSKADDFASLLVHAAFAHREGLLPTTVIGRATSRRNIPTGWIA